MRAAVSSKVNNTILEASSPREREGARKWKKKGVYNR